MSAALLAVGAVALAAAAWWLRRSAKVAVISFSAGLWIGRAIARAAAREADRVPVDGAR